MDDMFDEEGDEEEGQAIMDQVLDEIGVEISSKTKAPKISVQEKESEENDELEMRLKNLRS